MDDTSSSSSFDMEEPDILSTIGELLESDIAFYGTLRQFTNRDQLMALHQRNKAAMIALLQTMASRPRQTSRIIMQIGQTNPDSAFMEAVPIVATPAQLRTAVEREVRAPENIACSICQESLTVATRLRSCGHHFHAACINEWFTQSARCPMCRNDIRNADSDSSNE